MSDLDWSAPAKSEGPRLVNPWKVDVDPKRPLDPARIYEVPEIQKNVRLPIRHVATCEKKSDAELIVELYEKYRRNQ